MCGGDSPLGRIAAAHGHLMSNYFDHLIQLIVIIIIRLEARLQPNTGNTLGRASTAFTRSVILPLQLRRK